MRPTTQNQSSRRSSLWRVIRSTLGPRCSLRLATTRTNDVDQEARETDSTQTNHKRREPGAIRVRCELPNHWIENGRDQRPQVHCANCTNQERGQAIRPVLAQRDPAHQASQRTSHRRATIAGEKPLEELRRWLSVCHGRFPGSPSFQLGVCSTHSCQKYDQVSRDYPQ